MLYLVIFILWVISMLTILFDKDLIDSKRVRFNGKDYIYYIINNIIYEKHMNIINKVKTKNIFNCDFIN